MIPRRTNFREGHDRPKDKEAKKKKEKMMKPCMEDENKNMKED
jgi:hypothetical protein